MNRNFRHEFRQCKNRALALPCLILIILIVPHLARAESWSQKMGLVLSETSGQGQGQVLSVAPASFANVAGVLTSRPNARPQKWLASWQGIQPGDIVKELNGVAVASVRQFEDRATEFAARAPQAWTLEIQRNGISYHVEATRPCHPLRLIGCGYLPKGEN